MLHDSTIAEESLSCLWRGVPIGIGTTTLLARTFSISSKKTPARPEHKQSEIALTIPTMLFCRSYHALHRAPSDISRSCMAFITQSYKRSVYACYSSIWRSFFLSTYMRCWRRSRHLNHGHSDGKSHEGQPLSAEKGFAQNNDG